MTPRYCRCLQEFAVAKEQHVVQPPATVAPHAVTPELPRAAPLDSSPALPHQSRSYPLGPPRLARTPSVASHGSLDSASSRQAAKRLCTTSIWGGPVEFGLGRLGELRLGSCSAKPRKPFAVIAPDPTFPTGKVLTARLPRGLPISISSAVDHQQPPDSRISSPIGPPLPYPLPRRQSTHNEPRSLPPPPCLKGFAVRAAVGAPPRQVAPTPVTPQLAAPRRWARSPACPPEGVYRWQPPAHPAAHASLGVHRQPGHFAFSRAVGSSSGPAKGPGLR
ncbi:Uncharacterized protein GBIM_10001 [Gryllus bimaculatus]|nr:Uncharacterized protein GBIM_10001 [Gryllus bimaculatus]